MKGIRLHSKKHPNQIALVDDADCEALLQFRWHTFRPTDSRTLYAKTTVVEENGKQRDFYMHNVIFPFAKNLDHKDGNGLNNQRQNLRPATIQENNCNQRKQLDCSSKYKGVTWDKNRNKWHVQIQIRGPQGQRINRALGRYLDELEAAFAYDRAARKHFGEFARCNFGPGELL